MPNWLAHSLAPRAALVGVALGLLLWAVGMHALQAALCGWCAHVIVTAWLMYRQLWCATPEEMRNRAAMIAEGRKTILLLALLGAGVSMAAVVTEIALQYGGPAEMALAVATVLLSWGYVQLLFAQDYAHEYWQRDEGLEFPGGDGTPEFSEFLYLALNVGCALQVADTPTRTPAMRKLVSLHMVVAFFFNAIIVASTVNVVANLGER